MFSWRFNQIQKNISALVGATAFSQLAALAVVPFLAHWLGPAEMGVLGSFLAGLGVLLPLAALTLPFAIVVATSDEQARALARLSLLLCSGFILCGFWLYLALTAHVKLPDFMQNCWFVALLAIALFIAVAVQVAQQLLIRQQAFSVLAKADISQAFLLNSAKLMIAMIWPTALALAAVQAVLPLWHFWRLGGWQIWCDSQAQSAGNLPFTRMHLLSSFKDFPLYQAPSQALNAAALALPVFVLLWGFGPATAGFYTLATTLLLAPVSLVNKAIADVFYPLFRDMQLQQQNLAVAFRAITSKLMALGLVPVVLLYFSAHALFSVFFGPEWLTSADIVVWLLPWFYCFFVNPPAVKLVMLLRLQAQALLLNLFTLLLRIVFIGYGAFYLHDLAWAIKAYAFIGVVHNVLFVLLADWGCRHRAQGEHTQNEAS